MSTKQIMLHLVSCLTSMRESPEVWRHLARVKPPPRRKRTPQHILVSISRQVIRDGDFLNGPLLSEQGQKL